MDEEILVYTIGILHATLIGGFSILYNAMTGKSSTILDISTGSLLSMSWGLFESIFLLFESLYFM